MSVACFSIVGGNAKSGADASGTGFPKAGTTSRRIAQAIRFLQPRKAWGYLAQSLAMSERSARNRLAESREFSVDELAALIRSEDGLDVLRAVIAEARPKWWRLVSAFLDVADAQRLQAVAQRRITSAVRGAIEGNDALESEIARTTTALSLSDPEFAGPHIAAQRAFYRGGAADGGVRHRAVGRSEKAQR